MAKKILLADDSLTIQKVVELTFSDGEYDLVCVSNGQRALDRIAEGERPDLILADVVMPEKNGYEVCEAIKADPGTSRIPVVLLSGTFEPFDRDRAERLGCDAIVSKPFDSQQLLRQVEALLARAPSDVPSTATMAIPTMPNPMPPPPPAAPPPAPPAPAEAGFAPEDFTGSIRLPTPSPGGADLFEEEYGQADVESAIAAFERAHPEYKYVEDDALEAIKDREESEPSRPGSDEPASGGASVASWVHEEAEPAPRVTEPPAPTAPAAPAPFWVPRAPEPDFAPIPFGGDDTLSTHHPANPDPEPMRADEAPTQQIPLAAEYAALQHAMKAPADRDTDPTGTHHAPEERTAEIPTGEVRAMFEPPPEAAARPVRAPEAEGDVPREIEELAQTTSIGQLKEMLSSVSRPEGGLTDDEIDRLASRVVERLSERIVREIAWEVIPDVAELVIKQRIRELESGLE